jgi:hypothetical protein
MIYLNSLINLFSNKKKEETSNKQYTQIVDEPHTSKREISARYRESLSERLKKENLKFVESDSRMNYGMIGWIYRNNEKAIQLFGSTFYVHNKDIPINVPNIELIRAIQKEFANVTRDEKNNICVDPKGFGAID